jgi:Phage derived protein Gp49-like (DUF891)
MGSVLEVLRKLGYEEVAGMWRVHSTLHDYLLDLACFFPGRAPGQICPCARTRRSGATARRRDVGGAWGASFDRYSYARRNRESEVLRGQRLPVRGTFGRLLLDAQYGETPHGAKPLKGVGGAGVLELIEDHETNTCRAVYAVRVTEAVYVAAHFPEDVEDRSGDAPPRD